MLRLFPVMAFLAAGLSSCQSGSTSLQRSSQTNLTCKIHHLPLKDTKVRIQYGFPPPPGKDDPTPLQTAALFPHRTRSVNGGCVVGNERTSTIQACSGCDAAYARWLKSR